MADIKMLSSRFIATTTFGVMLFNLPPAPATAQEAGLELGKKVFLELSGPRCAQCHTLADARAEGKVGPILDELKPDAETVKTAVVNGIGAMPSYEDLTAEQVDAVALYVSTVAGKAK